MMTEMIEKKLAGIEIPEGLHEACMRGISRGERAMRRRRFAKFAAAAAAVVCMFALPGLANYVFGQFEDVYEGTAIVGQRIVQADSDFELSAETTSEGGIRISVQVINKEEVAYRYVQQLRLEGVSITDADGKTVYSAEAAVGDVVDGIAYITLEDADIEAGDYTLAVSGMKGLSKGDAPLDIYGSWQCDVLAE